MDLNDLINQEQLSVRSVNICLSNALLDLDSIKGFYKKNGTFLILKNCGLKTEKELITICNKYPDNKASFNKSLIDIYDELDEQSKSIISNYFLSRFHQLSNRPKKALQLLIGDELDIKKAFNTVSLEYFDFGSLPNVGKLAKEELNKFSMDLKVFFNDLLLSPEPNNSFNDRSILTSLFPIEKEQLNELFEGAEPDYLPIFKIIDHLTRQSYFFTENERLLFECYFMYKVGFVRKELGKISELNKITRERVRQLRDIFLENFAGKFRFIKNLTLSYASQYGVDTNLDIFIIEDRALDKINKKENTNFSKLFVTKIFAILLDNTHTIVGDEVNMHYVNQRKHEVNYKNLYLVNREILEVLDIEAFLNNLHFRVSSKIDETYYLNIRGMLSEFMKIPRPDMINRLRTVVEEIIYQEFEIVVICDTVEFAKNTATLNQDYAKEALMSLGISNKGHHIDKIFDFLTKKYPRQEFNAQSIASVMIREKDTFMCFGRTSTYGLKIWEKENVRGGTIRELVNDLLHKRNSPAHIDEILSYLLQFRSTNAKNVMSNLILDESNTFVVFPGQFVGLKSKSYDVIPQKLVGGLFTSRNLRKYNYKEINDVVNEISERYGYLPIQVSFVLKEKISKGEITLNHQNQLIIHG